MAGYDGKTNISHQDACLKLNKTYKVYREVINDSSERRTIFINNLAVVKSKAGKIKAANSLWQMEEGKNQQKSWPRTQRMDRYAQSGRGLSKIILLMKIIWWSNILRR